jgi:type IV secretory pathway VirB10-like protein
MKSSNPFLPAGELMAERARKSRERVKFGVYAVLIAHLALVMGLLIEGCKRDDSASTAAPTVATEPAVTSTNQPAVADATPQTNPVVTTVPAPAPAVLPVVSQTPPPPVPDPVMTPAPAPATLNPEPAVAKTDSFYVVKSGDSLSRIAKAHKTTVRALKAANGLKTDRIDAGRKLELPVMAVSKAQN